MWNMPENVVTARADNELPTISKEKHVSNEVSAVCNGGDNGS